MNYHHTIRMYRFNASTVIKQSRSTQVKPKEVLLKPGELKNKIFVQFDLDMSRLSVKLQPDGFDLRHNKL